MRHLTPEELIDLADLRLAPDQEQQANEHLGSCAACREELESYLRLTASLAGSDWVAPPDVLHAPLLDAFRRQPPVSAPSPTLWERILHRLRGPGSRGRLGWRPVLALSLLVIILTGLLLLTLPLSDVMAVSASAVSGSVEVQSEGAALWSPLEPGATLQPGDVLHTGPDGNLLVAYPDGSTTTLQPDTLLILAELQLQPRAILLDLRNGEILNHVVAGPPQARFEVVTPSSQLSSNQAEYRLGVDQFGGTYLAVDNGEVIISAAGSALTVTAGQQAYAPAGQPPRLVTAAPSLTPTDTPTVMPATATVTPLPAPTDTPAAFTATPFADDDNDLDDDLDDDTPGDDDDTPGDSDGPGDNDGDDSGPGENEGPGDNDDDSGPGDSEGPGDNDGDNSGPGDNDDDTDSGDNDDPGDNDGDNSGPGDNDGDNSDSGDND